MEWKFEKFSGDLAIYAFCHKCGFHYNPSTVQPDWTVTITSLYRYCPMCGEYLYVEDETVDVVWDKRSIIDLFKKEQNGQADK